jgi:hypothetical protein
MHGHAVERVGLVAIVIVALALGAAGSVGLITAAPHDQQSVAQSQTATTRDAAASVVLLSTLQQDETLNQ